MENFIAVFMVVVLVLVVVQLIASAFVVYKLFSVAKQVDEYVKLQEAASKDLVEAFTKMMSYLNNEFNNNFEINKKMQDWNEKAFEITNDNFSKLVSGHNSIQSFLGKMAEGMGLSFRSNLDDL